MKITACLKTSVQLLIGSLSGVVIAAEPGPQKPSLGVASGAVSGGYIFQLIGALLLVVFCIVAVIYLMKRLNGGYMAGGQHIKVISSLNVGTREKVMLLQVGEEQVLIGATPAGINKLHKLETPVKITEPTAKAPASFAAVLGSLGGKKSAENDAAETERE